MEKKKSIFCLIRAIIIFRTAFLIIVFLLPIAIILAFEIAFKNKIYPGVKAGSFPLGQMTPHQAEEFLINLASEASYELALVYEEQEFKFDLEPLGLSFYPQKTLDQAFAWGRNQNLFQNLADQYQALEKGVQVPLIFTFKEADFKSAFATISAQISQPQIPPQIKIENKKIEVSSGQLGKSVDFPGLLFQINQNLAQGTWSNSIAIPVKTSGFQPTAEEIEQAKEKAAKLLNKSLILTSSEQNFILTGLELIEFLDFKDGWEEEKVDAWVKSLAGGIEKEAQNALFKFEGGRVIEFRPETEGLSLNQAQTLNSIFRSLTALAQSEQEKIILELPLEKTAPQITTKNSNDLGITGLIAKGESWFHHSIASRIHNIKIGANKLHGVLIKPGEEFSFNQAIGEISQKTGYQQAYIIKEGRTVLGDGGGVCQISTTLFRAALNAGLPILERHAHAYRVSYYEINSPLGLDATVFSPSVDLKFKNDYPCHLLIQTEFNPASYYLAFALYGCPEERKVVLDNFQTWGIAPPPPDLYIEDPTLPAETVKQIDFKASGAKASFDWKVERNGEILYQQTFYSNYRPWQAIFLKGTGP